MLLPCNDPAACRWHVGQHEKAPLLCVAQDHFEAILFNVMRTRGFDDAHVSRYKMVTQFFQQRRPLIVLICGVPCTGTLAQAPSAHAPLPPST